MARSRSAVPRSRVATVSEKMAHRLLCAYPAFQELELGSTGNHLHQDTRQSNQQREDILWMFATVKNYLVTLSTYDTTLVQSICWERRTQASVARRLALPRGTLQHQLRRIYQALVLRLRVAGWTS
jgi:hypothetical protein